MDHPNPFQLDHDSTKKMLLYLQQHLPSTWITVLGDQGLDVFLLSRDPEKSVQRRVFFSVKGVVKISVHRKPIPKAIYESIIKDMCFSVHGKGWEEHMQWTLNVVKKLQSYEVCVGVDEAQYKPLWSIDKCGEVDNNPYGELRYRETFRPFACHLLVETDKIMKRRCTICIQTKTRFTIKMKNHNCLVLNPSTPNQYLDQDQLRNKVQRQQRKLKYCRAQMKRLREQLQLVLSQINSTATEELIKLCIFTKET